MSHSYLNHSRRACICCTDWWAGREVPLL